MREFELALEQCFGTWTLHNQLLCNCDLSCYYKGMYLNVAFPSCGLNNFKKIFRKDKLYLGKTLKDFYSSFNGLTFFCHSLIIYGVSKVIGRGYCPLDIEQMNDNLMKRFCLANKRLYSIGCYSKFEFCLKMDSKEERIYVVDKNNDLNIVSSFENIDSLLNYCVDKICLFYNLNGLKKNNLELTKNWMKNMCFDNIF